MGVGWGGTGQVVILLLSPVRMLMLALSTQHPVLRLRRLASADPLCLLGGGEGVEVTGIIFPIQSARGCWRCCPSARTSLSGQVNQVSPETSLGG